MIRIVVFIGITLHLLSWIPLEIHASIAAGSRSLREELAEQLPKRGSKKKGRRGGKRKHDRSENRDSLEAMSSEDSSKPLKTRSRRGSRGASVYVSSDFIIIISSINDALRRQDLAAESEGGGAAVGGELRPCHRLQR
jgi:hypothetical protein